MKAFILAGGLGTRLKPRFGDLPKPLAPLGGQPFLLRQLESLARHRVARAVVLAGHGADQLRSELGEHSAGVALEWSVEDEPLGTGGALKLAERFVEGPSLVVNGDTLAEGDPWLLERDRWEHGALGAVALYEVADARSRGRVEAGADGAVVRFVEKDDAWTGPAWVNGGVYAFTPAFWREIPAGRSSLERDVLPAVAARGRLHGRRCAGKFWDIGTPEDWERAERELAR
jgi:D-glycero-alpha-D-manno-heptose 1-phosphate guanylyltransferase